MKKFVMEKPFLELFPDCEIGILVCNGINNQPTDEEKYAPWLRENEKIAAKYFKAEEWTENPVVRVWRDAFHEFKTKKGVRCSIEALLKRVSNGGEIGCINPLVDIYNGISLKYGMPVGGENADAFQGDLRLTITEGGDEFLALGDEENNPTLPGELCYLDDQGAVCRCWNWRDGQRTMLTEETKNAFLIIESVDPSRHEDLMKIMDYIVEKSEEYLGAKLFAKDLITKANPQIAFK